jgi:hypothetical protein
MARLGIPLLLAAAVLTPAAASGQVIVSADSVRVTLAQGSETLVTLDVGSTAPTAFPICIDVMRTGQVHHPPGSLGAGCGPPGEMLLLRRSTGGDWPLAPAPVSLAMVPDGTLYVADAGNEHTYVYTSELDFITLFEHPVVEVMAPHSTTYGLTYNRDTDTLWWLNREVSQSTTWRVLLLEGDRNGIATGRRIELPVSDADPPGPSTNGLPSAASYDPAEKRYYFLDVLHELLWAVDTLGVTVPGFPMGLQGYPSAGFINGLDVHGGEDGDRNEVRLELPVYLPGEPIWRRVVVTDPDGGDLGLETMLPPLPWPDANLSGKALRSRVDPNGVMYGGVEGVEPGPVFIRALMAFRPVPLSPSWLTLSHWMGTIPAGGSTQVQLTFLAGQRAPGEYRSTLVVEDTAGVVLASVPLTLVVEADTPAEPGPGAEGGVRLAVSPNPITTTATAAITLASPASAATVTVHDVLGRQMALVHHGPLPAGDTPLALDARSLPAGVYVVRALVDGVAVAQRITVLR